MGWAGCVVRSPAVRRIHVRFVVLSHAMRVHHRPTHGQIEKTDPQQLQSAMPATGVPPPIARELPHMFVAVLLCVNG